MIKCLFALGLTLATLQGSALAGIYGSLRAQEQYIDDSQQAWEQQRYEYETACRLDEINQRLQELRAARLNEINRRLQELQADAEELDE